MCVVGRRGKRSKHDNIFAPDGNNRSHIMGAYARYTKHPQQDKTFLGYGGEGVLLAGFLCGVDRGHSRHRPPPPVHLQ